MTGRTRLSTGVILVAIIGIALATGTAAAATTPDGVGQQDVLYTHTEDGEPTADGHLDDGGLYWQGQTISFEDPDGELNASRLYIREYATDDGEVGALVREIEFDPDRTELDTAGLAGTYVLTPSGQRGTVVAFTDGIVGDTVDAENATAFEIQQQTLEADWVGGSAGTVSSERELELESNRVRYNVNVSSPSLSFEQLEAVFMGNRQLRDDNRPFGDRKPFEQRYRMYDTYADEDTIVLRGFGDGELETDFSSIDSFPETVTVEVTDTDLVRSVESPTTAAETGPFTISQLDVVDTVDIGGSVSMTATVVNDWPTDQSGEVVFRLGDAGTSVETRLDANEETTVSTMLTAPAEPGEIDYVAMTDGDRVTGTVTVVDPNPEPEDGSENEQASNEGGDSGGIVSTALDLLFPQALIGTIMTVLSVAGFVVWRRR